MEDEALTPCICERCQAEHFGGDYFLCPDCETLEPYYHLRPSDIERLKAFSKANPDYDPWATMKSLPPNNPLRIL
jgi:hypothetical protein